MRILVTAGNTFAPIDRVRGITNIFTGKTGAQIAVAAARAGHQVALLTSHPEVLTDRSQIALQQFTTFDEFRMWMNAMVQEGSLDVVVHAAAVSDYLVADVHPGKIKSDQEELILRLVRAPKLIDLVRKEWGFKGTLVKFKLEVGVEDVELLKIAEASRKQSDADLMVANTLEGAKEWAYLGPIAGKYERVNRFDLPGKLLGAIAGVRRG